ANFRCGYILAHHQVPHCSGSRSLGVTEISCRQELVSTGVENQFMSHPCDTVDVIGRVPGCEIMMNFQRYAIFQAPPRALPERKMPVLNQSEDRSSTRIQCDLCLVKTTLPCGRLARQYSSTKAGRTRATAAAAASGRKWARRTGNPAPPARCW